MKTPEERREYNRIWKNEWRKNNPEKDKEISARFRSKYREDAKERSRVWRETKPEKAKETSKNYYDNHRDQILRKGSAYLKAHKDKAQGYDKKNYERHKQEKQMKRSERLYKVTKHEYDQMLLSQGNRCAICKSVFVKAPHVDHDHATGIVRGLLCHNCNWGLGCFRDNTVALNNAIAYLETVIT